ncbi:DUF6525 family protein [Cognatishimia sp. SS12]|uniref:DUF6525 family protein n=1 Tax=Cognatishimia sp. SS12 TaxID=2979465 RepID=UPI00232DA4B2|nr:DUF6525 family protein [Cognatishimia sp. SS12]MDC0738848.1 DUF6525 family protein [Cognatishimia sp. SS12]
MTSRRNIGQTSLRRRRGARSPMRDYDNLPSELRGWMSSAVLPWRAQSVLRAYQAALARTGCKSRALAELDALQGRLLHKDAAKVWGTGYPTAG